MKRSLFLVFALGGIVSAWLVQRISPPVAVQAANEAPHFGEGGLPQFERDMNWPKVPAKYRMGFGSAVAVDSNDHIWILSRPKTLANPLSTKPDTSSTPAPPVMFPQRARAQRYCSGFARISFSRAAE